MVGTVLKKGLQNFPLGIKEAAASAKAKLDEYYPKSDALVHIIGLGT